jgi:predicted RNA polymerase sigma factor
MDEIATQNVSEWVDRLYRSESRRVFATLIRLLGDFGLAEEGLHEAFAAAISQWTRDGVPKNPRAWLVSTGRFKAIDTLRRRTRFNDSLYDLLASAESSPVIELNRAVAIAMRDGPLTGLQLVDEILAQGDLADYHLAHAARADLCRRLGKMADARASYQQALAIAGRFSSPMMRSTLASMKWVT